MIYTVTFSPAVDYIVDLDNLQLNAINRSKAEKVLPGGKGINVSIVLNNLGSTSVATGFVGGFTGTYIENELTKNGIKVDFVHLEENTRINVKVRGKGGETAINGNGPSIPDDKIEELMKKLSLLKDGDTLVISGTVPSTLPSNIYELILERLKDKKLELIIDSNKDILLKTLKYHPVLVKPNDEELEEMFGVKIHNDEELISTAKKLLELGSQNVIVSLGGDGALLVNNETTLKLPAPQGHVVNTVGAGDSLVAGFIDEYVKSHDVVKAFKQGIATGSASAFSENLAVKEDVEKLLQTIK
jgi:1-phosphofructokinase